MALRDKLAVWEKDLIDMSKRNPLLYYRPTGLRVSGLTFEQADANALFQRLVRSKRSLDHVERLLPDPDDDPLPLRRLERMRARARDDLKESGVHSLYLVFGMLDWSEAEHSDQRILSPLILVPVVLERPTNGVYTLSVADDEAIDINPTLREKLAYDFHVTLPLWPDLLTLPTNPDATAGPVISNSGARTSGHASTPLLTEALARIESALRQIPEYTRANWALTSGVYLGRFSFTKLVMREDLMRNEAAALAHPVLRKMSGERGAMHEPTSLVSAERLDERVRPQDTLAILDADSSQEEAIQAAIAGQSFVLQGPPGTGKSQTIANIIAELLGRGKKVLFVSEKMAALDVVRKRLDGAGLGPFLLDLHDAKRNKKEFIGELQASTAQARVEPSARTSEDWKQYSGGVEQRRAQLNTYVRELHAKRFALDRSVFEVNGQLAKLKSTAVSTAPIEGVTALTQSGLTDIRDALDNLLNYTDALDTYTTHPWRKTPLTSISGEQATDLEYHFGQLSEAIGAGDAAFTTLGASLAFRRQ